MAKAIKKTEFLINGEWSLFEESEVDIDTYSNLRARQGNIDLPHKSRIFKGGVITEIEKTIVLGEETVTRFTTTFMPKPA